ncbi:MAG: DMT family transporter [Promethearchaeota archaeon]
MKAKTMIALLLSSFFWALPPAFGKLIVDELSPFFITAFRLVFSLFIFLPIMFKKKNIQNLKGIGKKTFLMFVISGALFFGPHYIIYFYGLRFTLAIHVSVLVNFGFLFSALFCFIFLKDRASKPVVISLIISFCGLFFITLSGNNGGGSGGSLSVLDVFIGDLMIITYGLLWSGYSIINKKYLPLVGNTPAIFLTYLFALSVVFPFSIEGIPHALSVLPKVIFPLIVIAFFGSILGYYFYNLGIKDIEGSRASVVLLTSPVFGIIISVLLLGETMTFPFIIGAAMILTSTLLVVREEKDKTLEIVGE